MKKKIDASIIIRTKNEEQWIDYCLKNIFNQIEVTYEVIIVDNASKDKTIDKAKKYPVKILKIDKFFPGKAINLGFKSAKGKYLVCLSAHCIPENELWLKSLLNGFKNKKIAGVYGRQKPLPYSSSFDKRDLITVFGPEKKIQKKDSFFHNANSAIRRDIWLKFPFDEKTKHIEDKIWAHKVIKNNYHLMYEPKSSVFHYHGINQDMNKERCDEIVKILENLDNEYKAKNFLSPKTANIIAIIPHYGEILKINNQLLIENTLQAVEKCKNIKNIFIPTDNILIKQYVQKRKLCKAIMRPKNLSNNFVSITTVLQYTLMKIEELNIFPDLVIVATENFPFRSKEIFEKMISKIIKNNYDILICDKNEKGSIILKNKNERNVLIDGVVPKSLVKTRYSTTRIGFGCIMRPTNIRSGNLIDGKIGAMTIKDHKQYLEVNKLNVKKFNNLKI